MSDDFLIELSPVYYQGVSATLDGVRYQFDFLWSEINNTWLMDIYDKDRKALKTGLCTRLEVNQFRHFSTPHKLIFKGEEPTRNNLGRGYDLHFEKVSDV